MYYDTSAFAKKYLVEEGSETVLKLIEEDGAILTSALTELEIVTTVENAKRRGRLQSPLYRDVVRSLERDFGGIYLNVIGVATDIIQEAKRIIRQRRLRAPDAIQLASALDAKERLGDSLEFCCADQALLEAARLEGLRCVDVSR